MKKSNKRVIELKAKDESLSKQTKWEVMVPCGLEEFRMVEVIADEWTGEDIEGAITFWKGPNFEEAEDVAVFKEWIYAIKKPLV